MPTTKKQLKVLQKFTAGIMKVLEEHGIEMEVRQDIDPSDVESRFSAVGKAMTKYGLLDIHVHTNWIHTRFDLPALAARGGLFSNPHSGKWNFHYSDETFGSDPTYMENCILDFGLRLDQVEARTWTLAHSTVTAEEVGSHSKAYWDNRRGMGEAFTIEGQDSERIAEFLADNWTDTDGNIPNWFRTSNQAFLSRCDDIDLFFHLKSFSERNDVELAQFFEAAPALTVA
jgi:hypothetical protein